MSILTFSLNPEAFNKIYDNLVCLGKFSDYVSLEASSHKLVLTTFNSTKSAYASFTLGATKFFSKYNYKPNSVGKQTKDKFVFRIYNRALISVFKGRAIDQNRDKETAVERCDAHVEDDDEYSKSQFVVKITCRHGVRKIHKLTFESIPATHALFDREIAHNFWSISSRVLKELTDHFGPGTEQLEIYTVDGRVNFTSSTEKIMSGNGLKRIHHNFITSLFMIEILKKPLQTTIAMDKQEFSEFNVEELLHIVISVKDFKAIVTHCSGSNTMVKAFYSNPFSPMKLTYDIEGMLSEFILMTIGELSVTPSISERHKNSTRPASRQITLVKSDSKGETPPNLPRPIPSNKITTSPILLKNSPPPPQPTVQYESLFFPQADDDRKWDPTSYEEEDEEILLWDVREKHSTILGFKRSNSTSPVNNKTPSDKSNMVDQEKYDPIVTNGVPPTQRLSQVRKLGILD